MLQFSQDVQAIAFFSDLHGKLDRLLRAMELKAEIAHWISLGDNVDMFAPDHENIPTVRFLARQNIPSILGNHEAHIRRHHLRKYEPESQAYLLHLPVFMDIQFADFNIRLYHATPTSLVDFIPENAGEQIYLDLFDHLMHDVIVLGHTHIAFHRKIGHRTFINPGSLGGLSNRATFAVLNRNGSVELSSL
ncbi:metallophosphoesterase family protein [candidate division KSB1 bacterium]|nr:metallophosphoesterase family protein [candidate division KSB1 bacterium]